MNKTLKKIISLVLAVLMIMTVAAVGFIACAEGADETVTETVEDHPMMWEVFWEFCKSIYGFFKYIFYDVFLGKAP